VYFLTLNPPMLSTGFTVKLAVELFTAEGRRIKGTMVTIQQLHALLVARNPDKSSLTNRNPFVTQAFLFLPLFVTWPGHCAKGRRNPDGCTCKQIARRAWSNQGLVCAACCCCARAFDAANNLREEETQCGIYVV